MNIHHCRTEDRSKELIVVYTAVHQTRDTLFSYTHTPTCSHFNVDDCTFSHKIQHDNYSKWFNNIVVKKTFFSRIFKNQNVEHFVKLDETN